MNCDEQDKVITYHHKMRGKVVSFHFELFVNRRTKQRLLLERGIVKLIFIGNSRDYDLVARW